MSCAWSMKTLVVLCASLFFSLPALDPSEHFVSADESMAQNTPSIRADHRPLSCSIEEDLPCTQPLSKWMQNVQISPPLLINWGGNYVRAAVRPDASELCSQSLGGKLRLTNTKCGVRSCSDSTEHIWYWTHLRPHWSIWNHVCCAFIYFFKGVMFKGKMLGLKI